MLENSQEVRESQVVNLSAPQLLHGFDVQRFKAHYIIVFAQLMGKLPVIVPALISNAPMHSGKVHSCSMTVVATLLLT